MQPSANVTMDLDRPAAPRPATPFDLAAKELQVRIGAAIRRRRRAVEVTLLELARVCGVSFQQVQKYESGACSISAAQLWNMAQALGVPINYFYEAAHDDRAHAGAA
jgi:ribosome-binding protein aMBF1 (putative translation factor)